MPELKTAWEHEHCAGKLAKEPIDLNDEAAVVRCLASYSTNRPKRGWNGRIWKRAKEIREEKAKEG